MEPITTTKSNELCTGSAPECVKFRGLHVYLILNKENLHWALCLIYKAKSPKFDMFTNLYQARPVSL